MDLSVWITGDETWTPTKAGERVTVETALGLAAVSRAVSLLSDIASTLPVDTFRDLDGTPQPTRKPPLVARPTTVVSQRVWRYQAMVSWLIWGNAYGLVSTRDTFGFPTTVDWLDPSTVQVDEPSSLRRPSFSVNGRTFGDGELLHVPGKHVRPGSAIAVAPLSRFKETFALGLAARNFGAQWFGQGAHPSAILSTDKAVDKDEAETIKARFVQAIRGKREPAVLGAGMTYTPIQTPANESQFIETQEQVTVDVARAFDLPPESIGGAVRGSSVTYANREQRVLDLLAFGADPWLVLMEDDLYTANLPDPEYAKFNRGGLLRADLAGRYASYDKGIRAGFLSVNDVLRLEDRPPIDDGDQYLWPPYRAFPVQSDQED